MVYWISHLEDRCQTCNRPYDGIMYDCQVYMGHWTWANVCRDCHVEKGCGTGLGLGQKYEQQRDGRWLKTEG